MRNDKNECRYIIYFGDNSITAIRVEDDKGEDVTQVIKEYIGTNTIGALCKDADVAIITSFDSCISNDFNSVWINFFPTDTVVRENTILCGCKFKEQTDRKMFAKASSFHMFGLTIEEISEIFKYSFINYQRLAKIDWFCTHLGIKNQVRR